MEPYVAFSDKVILEGAIPWGRSLEVQTWAIILVKTQSAPAEEPTEVTAPTEEAAPTKEPTEFVDPTKVSSKESDPTEVPTEVLAPMVVSTKEPAALLAAISGPVEEPNVPLSSVRRREEEKLPIAVSLPGQRYCILPSWQPLLDKPLCLSVS